MGVSWDKREGGGWVDADVPGLILISSSYKRLCLGHKRCRTALECWTLDEELRQIRRRDFVLTGQIGQTRLFFELKYRVTSLVEHSLKASVTPRI